MSDVTPPTSDLPQEAYAATLAGLGPLGPARLERLFGHWSPSEAWAAVKAGRATGVWGRGEAPATVHKAEQVLCRAVGRCRSRSVVGAVPGGERRGAAARGDRLPRGAGRRPVAPTRAVRPGRPRRPRRTARHDRGHPQRHRGRAGGGRRARGRPGAGRRPGRVGPGARHRRLGSQRRALGPGRRTACRRGGQRARCGVPARAPPALGGGGRAGPAAQRGASWHGAACPALPVAQPHPRGAGRGARRGRVQAQGRFAHHRRRGPAPGAEGVRGAGLSAQRGCRRDQRPADRGCRSGACARPTC